MQRILAIIPARYASSRFPGKPLVDLCGKTMIQRVYEQARKSKALQEVVVATDDDRIFNHVRSFGGHVVMTHTHHNSGTERCCEAFKQLGTTFNYIINIQGDEPFIDPEQIDLLANALNGATEIATMAKKITDTYTLFNPNVVKVVFNQGGKALYFSRQPIPSVRNQPQEKWHLQGIHYKHIGLYAYRADILEKITLLPPSRNEQAEVLEQLRWLDNGYNIQVIETTVETLGIDAPEDADKARKLLGLA